ncbi:MAG TPA: Zn-dependent hydrolase [Amycolatopsis sp.]|nr:Zn-dependent hydrolase [Amycolatopsis sp.]
MTTPTCADSPADSFVDSFAVDARRVDAWLAEFAALTEPGSGAGVTRLAYTPLERRAHEIFARAMTDLGLKVWTDAAGNTIAERPGTGAPRPVLATGSHLDSVPGGGRFDGIAGVVAALEVARCYAETGARHRFPVWFVAFAAEEGARFGQACTGSRVVAGLTGARDLEAKRDAEGVTLAEAMRGVGLAPERTAEARWQPGDCAAFLELHVEQGGVLESRAKRIGVVDLISGSTRFRLRLTGRASHTGATSMHLRADALAAAAEVVLLIESIARDSGHLGVRATVGRLAVRPGSITTIPGETELSVDLRDVDADRQRQTAAEIVARARAICARRGVTLAAEALADASPVVLPRWLRDVLAGACAAEGVDYQVLPSGASHDSQMVNHVAPAGMVFVPSRDGVSHVPAEWTSTEDLVLGIRILATSLAEVDRLLGSAG